MCVVVTSMDVGNYSIKSNHDLFNTGAWCFTHWFSRKVLLFDQFTNRKSRSTQQEQVDIFPYLKIRHLCVKLIKTLGRELCGQVK